MPVARAVTLRATGHGAARHIRAEVVHEKLFIADTSLNQRIGGRQAVDRNAFRAHLEAGVVAGDTAGCRLPGNNAAVQGLGADGKAGRIDRHITQLQAVGL